MNLANRFTPRTRLVTSICFDNIIILFFIASVISTFVFATLGVAPAVAQYGNELELRGVRTPAGFTKSKALGIAKNGWAPLTMVGVMETTSGQDKASCWIYTSQQWMTHELPGLDPNGDSWANGVVHVPWTGGEYTAVAGASADSTSTYKPMSWCNVTNQPWEGHALMTLNGGDGEARDLFLPDGTPVRTLYCGWAGETPPTAAKGPVRAATMKIAVPMIWETMSTGERLLRPDFGVGLAGAVNNIGSSGLDGFIAVGGGETSTGSPWRPQVWMSVDDGETWQNTELPLPVGMDMGEATDHTGHENGHILMVSGYARATIGLRTPVVWDIDLDMAVPMWVAHELPLPSGKEGGQNNHIHKLPGRLKFAGAVLNAEDELAVWTDDGTGWVVELPADYLVNPEAGTPIAAAGIDAFGRIAATALPPEPVALASRTAAQTDTSVAVLVPSPATGVGPAPTPRTYIALTASPNPFNPTVRIGYTLPQDGRVTLTIYDAAGRVVTSFDEGRARAGVERAVYWDGTTRSGERATSGVYFVRVATGYEIATAKIVLVK